MSVKVEGESRNSYSVYLEGDANAIESHQSDCNFNDFRKHVLERKQFAPKQRHEMSFVVRRLLLSSRAAELT